MERREREAGYVLVSVALTLVLLCAFAALAIDTGVLFAARSGARRSADSAALAGAFTFVVQPSAPQPATAQSHALAAALANNILDEPITAAEVNVQVDVANRLVTVDINHPRNTFFARALGQNVVTAAGRGIAEASPNATGSSCTKPWFIPNTMGSTQQACDACTAGEVLLDSSGLPTAFALTKFGTEFTIRPTNPTGALGPGNFYSIRMPDSQGGADYRTNIATCSTNFVYCAQTYGVQPGNMVGPTRQGVIELMGDPADTYVAVGQYRDGQTGTINDTSPQLVVAPVWDTCTLAGFCPDNRLPDGGATAQIAVVGYALVFIDGFQGPDVKARLISVSGCQSAGGGGGGVTGPYAQPVRLVRVP